MFFNFEIRSEFSELQSQSQSGLTKTRFYHVSHMAKYSTNDPKLCNF